MKTDKAFSYFIGSMVGCVLLLCISFLLSFTILQHSGHDKSDTKAEDKTVNEFRVLAQFYTIGAMDSSQQSEIIPFEKNTQNQELVDEMIVRYYLDMRYSSIPDGIEMLRRWRPSSPFARFTTSKIYSDFVGDLEKKLKNVAGAPIVRTIDIKAIKSEKYGMNEGTPKKKYTVDFDIYNRATDGQEKIQKKRVIIRLQHNRKRKSTHKDFANPYGTIITSFVETERK